jgi:hypothetical protein
MEKPMISRKLEKELTKLFLTDGEVLIQSCDNKTKQPLFQVSKHIIKDKNIPTYGLPLYGLFGYLNGKCLLMLIGYQKDDIMSEFFDFSPLPDKN